MSNDSHLKYYKASIDLANEFLTGGSLSHGLERNWVTEFELEFSKISGHSHNIAVNSGTSALHSALVAFGVGKGDEVIMPAMSVVMNAYSALAIGAKPIFADIDELDWNMNLQSIKKVVSAKTKAIISVSWFGAPTDLKPIMNFAKDRQILVLEDAAESLGATYYNKPSGFFADAVAYSFENKKHLTTGGEGGMISCSHGGIALKARKFSGLGYKHLTADAARTSLATSEFQRPDYERYDTLSLNYRMSPLAAAVGIGQLYNIEEIVSKRIESGSKFVELLGSHKDFIPQQVNPNGKHSYYTAGVRYVGKKKWKHIYDEVVTEGGDGFYGCVLNPYLEPVFKNKKYSNQNLNLGLCQVAELIQPQIMALKTNYRQQKDLERNLNAWRKVLSRI